MKIKFWHLSLITLIGIIILSVIFSPLESIQIVGVIFMIVGIILMFMALQNVTIVDTEKKE